MLNDDATPSTNIYLTVTNITTGTISDARLPNTITSNITGNADQQQL